MGQASQREFTGVKSDGMFGGWFCLDRKVHMQSHGGNFVRNGECFY